VLLLGELYTSDRDGSDECGDGTEQKPFKTVLQVSISSMNVFWGMDVKRIFAA